MQRTIYMNGEHVPAEQATVSVYDHGLLYGDGVFEGIRRYSGNVFRLDQHVQRLYESARSIMLEIPMSPQEMADGIVASFDANDLPDGYARVVVTRGVGDLGLSPTTCKTPQVIVITDRIRLYPDEIYANGLDIVTASTARSYNNSLPSRIKSLNYLNNILAKMEGQRAGCVEALMLNSAGEVAECTADNIFLVTGGVLKTPPVSAGILEGITRNAVIELAGQHGIVVEQPTLIRHDLYTADECFLTGTAAELIPVVKLDSRPIGAGTPGPVFRKLLAAFRELVKTG